MTNLSEKFSNLYSSDRVILIRKILKEHGYSNRMVSVRLSHSGFDNDISINIKNPNVDKDFIIELARASEKIRFDEYGECLQGLNTFVMVYDLTKTESKLIYC